jgi:hypothetical protein
MKSKVVERNCRRKTPSLYSLLPSKELAYFIGATLGDGHLRKRDKIILFRVKDYDFAYTYSKYYDIIEGRKDGRPTKPKPIQINGRKMWCVEIHSTTLYELIKEAKKIANIARRFIEFNVETIRFFLRGFFDAEGGVELNRKVYCSNKNEELIKYIHRLLKKIGVDSHLKIKRTSRQDKIAYINIYGKNIKKYADLVGFEIKRKQERLQLTISDERYQIRYFIEFLNWIFKSKEATQHFLKKFLKYRGKKDYSTIRIEFGDIKKAKVLSSMLETINVKYKVRKRDSNRIEVSFKADELKDIYAA